MEPKRPSSIHIKKSIGDNYDNVFTYEKLEWDILGEWTYGEEAADLHAR